MSQFRTNRAFDVIFLLCLAGGLWWVAQNRIGISDWMFFNSFHADPQTIAVANDAGLSDYGRHMLYRTNPTFASREVVSKVCDIENLGCITSHGQVYILDERGKPAQTIVTAAHEMLHLAYRRLTPAKRDELAPEIDHAIAMNVGSDLATELSSQTDLEARRDEAHSLLGTEYHHLPPELEQYYAQYFTNRSKVLTSSDNSQ